MAAGQLIIPNYMPVTDANGKVSPGAKLAFFKNGTTDPIPVYADQALTVPLANPLYSDASGKFVEMFAAAETVYTVKVYSASGVPYAVFNGLTAIGGGAGAISYADNQNLTAEQQITARINLGISAFKIVLQWAAGDQAARIQSQLAVLTLAGGGTVELDRPPVGQVWEISPGVIKLTGNNQRLRGVDRGVTLRFNGPLSAVTAGIFVNGRSNIVIEDLTIDASATLLYNYALSTALAGAPTFQAKAGKQYRVAIRGAVAATLTLSGPFAASLVVTGIGMVSGATVVYGYLTATADGVATLTPSGNINYVSVMENGAALSGAISMYNASIITLKNVSIINMDTFGISSNSCQSVEINNCLVQRSGASWDQNVGILSANTLGTASGFSIRNNTAVLNTGITLSTLRGYVETGTFVDNVGYSSKVTILGGYCYIGQVTGGANANWPDMDDTPPLWHELYGRGTLDQMYCTGNNAAGVSIGGNWRLINPYVWDTCAYYAAYGIYTVAAITFFAVDPVNTAKGSYVTNPDCGDTRAGGLRTQGVGIADLDSTISDTVVVGARLTNHRTSNTDFKGTVNRVFSYADNGPGYATQGDADLTWLYGVNPSLIDVTANLTANRTITLSNTNVRAGIAVDLARHGLGAFNLIVKDGAGTTLLTMAGAVARWAQFVHNGAQFVLAKKGDL